MYVSLLVFYLGFFVWGGGGRLYAKIDCVQSMQSFCRPICPFLSSCTKKESKVYQSHYYRHTHIYCNSQNFWGESWRVWGGKLPPYPPVDETLPVSLISIYNNSTPSLTPRVYNMRGRVSYYSVRAVCEVHGSYTVGFSVCTY